MAIEVRNEVAITPGDHTGVIVSARETTKTFDPSKGPEDVVAIEILPDFDVPEGAEVVLVEVTFSPVINGLSALSQFLKRLGAHPEPGTQWSPSELEGTRVRFSATKTDSGFIRVQKPSLTGV